MKKLVMPFMILVAAVAITTGGLLSSPQVEAKAINTTAIDLAVNHCMQEQSVKKLQKLDKTQLSARLKVCADVQKTVTALCENTGKQSACTAQEQLEVAGMTDKLALVQML